MPNFYAKHLLVALTWTPLLVSCDANDGVYSKTKLATGDDQVGLPYIDALGDSCLPSDTASTMPGFNARIALHIRNANLQSHSLGYMGEAPNFSLSASEALMIAPPSEGTYTITLLLRRRSDCDAAQKRGQAISCELNFRNTIKAESFDVVKKIHFVVSGSLEKYVSQTKLGSGQDNIVSDIVNGTGFVGFLGRMGFLSILNPNLGAMVAISEKANENLETVRTLSSIPKAGCSLEAQAQRNSNQPNPVQQQTPDGSSE